METRRIFQDPRVRVALLTLSCFLLTSTGWLLWLYHLMDIASAEFVDLLTMGVGYIMQAVGIGMFAFFARGLAEERLRHSSLLSIICFVACLVPATLAPPLAPTLAFGYLANVACGYIQAYYLYCLSRHIDKAHRGTVFGSAYAASTVLGWLLSAFAGGMLTRGLAGLTCCALLAVGTTIAVKDPVPPLPEDAADPHDTDDATESLALACAVVALVSMTKGIGFNFPATQLLEGVSLEFSRLLYGVGLVGAGLIIDRDRRLGALCCAAALAMPFLMIALSGAVAPATLMWALGYLLNGFFSVFRVVVLSDLAASRKQPLLAGLGLLFGRVGDATGTALSIALAGSPLTLILLASVVFACTIALFFMLYQQLYASESAPVPTEREIFERFAARHDLSQREREVLRMLLDGHTNAEIAGALFVSEATVKFHVRNLLRKTGCTSRLDILALYAGGRSDAER